MLRGSEAREMIRKVAAEFPEQFGFRNFPGDVFSIDPWSSFVADDDKTVMLYTSIKKGEGKWGSFAKGTESELRRNIVHLPECKCPTCGQ